MIPRRRLRLTGLLLLALPVAVDAQEGPLRSRLSETEGTLAIEIGDLFDEEIRDALQEGFPLRAQLVVTLWRDGFLDRRVDAFEWRASVRPEGGRFQVQIAGEPARAVDDLETLRSALSRRFAVPLRPPEPGRYFYDVALDVECLSTSDLHALEEWLRGSAAPDDGPDPDDEGTLTRGVRGLFVRALGLPRRSLERRTRTFGWRG
ncbi:MAG: hypothetical protein R3E10_18750 [Gemmatimonadota bacterium]